MNTALEYSTRVVQEGGRRCKKSSLNDLVHLTPLRIPLMNPPIVCIFDPACVLLPLYLPSDLLPPPPFPNKMYSYTDSVWCGGVGVGVLSCTVDHILQEFYTLFLTRYRTYKIASPPQTKMSSKDDIKGLIGVFKIPSSMHCIKSKLYLAK
jgi:hypothetical protein